MTQLDDVRALLDQPGRDLNEAARYYAEHGTDVPAAIQAQPVLYGELARGALQWTADLLTAVEQCVALRPAAGAAVAPFMDSVAAYFAGSSRWPTVAHLGQPLLLLVPAYYVAHGVHLLEYHVPSPLLSVAFDEPLSFMEEVLGRGASMAIRQHKNADLSSMPKVVPHAPGYEPLIFRSFLSNRRRARLRVARRVTYYSYLPVPFTALAYPDRTRRLYRTERSRRDRNRDIYRDTARHSDHIAGRELLRPPALFPWFLVVLRVRIPSDLLDAGTYRLRETVITRSAAPTSPSAVSRVPQSRRATGS